MGANKLFLRTPPVPLKSPVSELVSARASQALNSKDTQTPPPILEDGPVRRRETSSSVDIIEAMSKLVPPIASDEFATTTVALNNVKDSALSQPVRRMDMSVADKNEGM